MPVYTVQSKSGKVYTIEGPEGATAEQLGAHIRKSEMGMFPQSQDEVGQLKKDTRNPGLAAQRNAFVDGVKAMVAAPLVGGAQRLGLEGSQNTADAWNEDVADISIRPGGAPGLIAGGVGVAAPLALIPAANTVVGGAIAGAIQGALQPTQQGQSAVANTLGGGVVGAALPAMINTAKGVKAAAIDPFTEAGRNRIAGGVLNRMAGSDVQNVVPRLASAQGNTPGFVPSVAQAARNDGLSAFERTMRGVNPQAFQQLDQTQRGALVSALMGIAKTPEERAAAVALRDSAAESLYGRAFQTDAMRRDLAKQQLQQRSMIAGAGIHQAANAVEVQLAEDLSTPGLRELATRPMFAQAVNDARTLAANRGSRISDPLQSLEGLHNVKLALDDMANPGAASALGRNANAARNDMGHRLQEELATISPLYGNARQTFADMSVPINQMDVGQELYKRFVPALADQGNFPFRNNAQSYAQALRNGDALAKNVTGFKGATLEGVMTPEQMATLRGVAQDAEMKAAAEAGGKGVGSDTVQKIAMSHIGAEAGIPNWLSSIARVPGGWAKRAGDILYKNADDALRENLGFLLTNPQEAAQAMQAAGATPSRLAEILKRGAQGVALSSPSTLPALSAE